MNGKVGAVLSPSHRKLYKRVPYYESALGGGEMLQHLLLIGLASAAVALLLPFIPTRRGEVRVPGSLEEYMPKLLFSVFLAVLLFGWGVSEFLVKPSRNRQLGYRLVGEFVVREKVELLGSVWLELAPVDTHRIAILRPLAATIHPGDVVEVLYSASDELIGVRKIS